ncbi:dethiobiotin synthetase [Striga asiatica]|uniref:Dethiobiotin synthetase n=1 Tax=Striga asiatica TaxID=4170 RepID=A0A5A7PVX5_STRAF|nr:dethiobiotin synthetase [Striga asiatica]
MNRGLVLLGLEDVRQDLCTLQWVIKMQRNLESLLRFNLPFAFTKHPNIENAHSVVEQGRPVLAATTPFLPSPSAGLRLLDRRGGVVVRAHAGDGFRPSAGDDPILVVEMRRAGGGVGHHGQILVLVLLVPSDESPDFAAAAGGKFGGVGRNRGVV